jgi:hypothetical protein
MKTQISLRLLTAGAALLTLSVLQLGCSSSSTPTSSGSNGTDSTSNASQAAMAETNNQAQATESSTAVGLIEDGVDPQGSVHTLSTCSFASTRGTCSSSPYTDTITWGGCTIDGGKAAMNGSWNEVFTGTSDSSCTVPIVSGETVVRTSSGSTLTVENGSALDGSTIETDTDGGTAWDGTVIPSTGTTVVNSSGTRTITIHGTHKTGKGPLGGTLYDHFIVTSTPLTVTGTRALGTRTVTGGGITVYHNLAHYTADLAFTGVTWGSSACCYPTAGSISGTLTGSITGTTTLTFSSTCGAATYVDTTGASSLLTLTQCN